MDAFAGFLQLKYTLNVTSVRKDFLFEFLIFDRWTIALSVIHSDRREVTQFTPRKLRLEYFLAENFYIYYFLDTPLLA